MSARSLAVTGAVVVGVAFALVQVPIDPWSNHDLTMILPVQGAREQQPDSLRLKRLAEAFENAKTVHDSARLEFSRGLVLTQDSARVRLLTAPECPMPVATDSTSSPIPTLRSSTKHAMPVLKVPCFNPLFAGVKPDSQ